MSPLTSASWADDITWSNNCVIISEWRAILVRHLGFLFFFSKPQKASKVGSEVMKTNQNKIKWHKHFKNATRKLLFHFKTCLSKYGCHGNVKTRGQWHFISICCQLRGNNHNYRSRAVAKGFLRTIFCGMLFWNVFYRKMTNCFREDTYFKKIVIARARLVPVPNRASDFRSPKTLRKGGMLPIF